MNMDYPIIGSEIYKVRNYNAKQLVHFRILSTSFLRGPVLCSIGKLSKCCGWWLMTISIWHNFHFHFHLTVISIWHNFHLVLQFISTLWRWRFELDGSALGLDWYHIPMLPQSWTISSSTSTKSNILYHLLIPDSTTICKTDSFIST